MARRQRQLDELQKICGSGAVARAVDLAFAHFADFGPDREIVALLHGAIDSFGASAGVLCRFAELQAQCSC